MTEIARDQLRYPLSLALRIDWSELDLFGHVNNLAYLKYIQASRVNYWEQIGLTELFKTDRIGPMLLSTSCVFKKQLHYPGNITVEARFDFIGNTSFGIHHRILNSAYEVAAEAQDVILMFDFKSQQKVPFPPVYKERVETLEQRKL